MKKNTLQKVLALALTGVMAFGVTACGNSNNSTTNNSTASTPTSQAESQVEDSTVTDDAAVAGMEGWTAFDSTVNLSIPVYDRGVEGVPTVSDNYWTKWIQENFGDKYNINVTFVPITRTDQMTSYALLAAAQDLPTILMEYDYFRLAKWSADGYLATYNLDEFAQVAPTYYNRMVDQNQLIYTEMSGETYFALAERPYYDVGYKWQDFVRMDWLREVGYDYVPMIYSEWLDAMTKIQEAGICEYPAGGVMLSGVGSDQNYGFRTYPQNEEEWAKYSSVSIPSLGTDPDYKLIKRENQKYNDGLLNPEYYITDEEADKAAFINGNKYQHGTYIASNVDWLVSFYAQNPDAELALVPAGVVDTEGGTVPAYRSENPFGMIIGFSSMASEDELKAAWMYMEWMTQEDNLFEFQWGIEGENYVINAETGLPESVADYSGDYKQGYNNNKDYYCVTIEARNAGTIEDLIRMDSPQGLPQDFTQDILDKYYANKELAEQGRAQTDPIFATVIEAESEYSGSLVSLYVEYRNNLTMCAPDKFDALYEELTQKYLDAGYQAIIDERLAAYQSGQSTKLR